MEDKTMDSDMEESARIGSYMRSLLEKYEAMRGKVHKQGSGEFWDLVVISAGDAAQESWYRAQLELKASCGELPGAPFLCVADPPGPRIGSGGSTLHILEHVDRLYPGRLEEWKILIIHAGGYSKRLPSHSCAGKIFSPLPISCGPGGLPYQMLDLKLALYLPFLEAMEPGVFITASDDIEVFCLTSPVVGSPGEAVTALAHPSSLYIGTTHGVYVMEEQEGEKEELHHLWPCLEVLQKPSVELMRSLGAVLAREGRDTVYSDSAFWFHAATARKLILLQGQVAPLNSELCIYGDLLTCLGERREKEFVSRLHSQPQGTAGLAARRALQEKLGDTRLAVLALHASKFYHLGTTQEYLHGLTGNKQLRLELNLENVVWSKVSHPSPVAGVVLHSHLSQEVTLPQDSIIEYSIIEAKVHLGPKTILSSVHITEPLSLPPGFLFHTVPISVAGSCQFVTVAFHHTDDMKYTTGQGQSGNLQYGGRLLEEVYSGGATSQDIVFPAPGPASLWTARLFPSRSSMAESFKATVGIVASLGQKLQTKEQVSGDAYSMEDLVKLKDCTQMLVFRKRLNDLCSS